MGIMQCLGLRVEGLGFRDTGSVGVVLLTGPVLRTWGYCFQALGRPGLHHVALRRHYALSFMLQLRVVVGLQQSLSADIECAEMRFTP